MRRLLLCLGLVACNEQGFTEQTKVDVFRQEARNSVDLLVVIDNSCSMVEEQDNLASNFDALLQTFAAADVDWQLAVTTTDTADVRFRGLLMGGDDEIILRSENGQIDSLAYNRDWVFEAGTSLQLSPYGFSSNDIASNWCASPGTFGDGDHGSPGVWNPTCAGVPTNVPTPSDDNGPRPPLAQEVIVTEVMAQSSGLDSACEWFELTNRTDDTLNLTGFNIADSGRNSADVPSGTLIGPYEALVFGRAASDNCDTPVDVVLTEGFSLNHDVRVLNPETPDVSELFAELVAQGTTGNGLEQGLDGARLVFEEPYFTESNQGFLREEANLSILFVSDEEDRSGWAAHEYVRFFTDLKGDRAYRDRSVVNLSAVVGKDEPPQNGLPACESEAGVAAYGERYLAVANETQGLVESICEADFAPIVEELGLTLSGLSVDFELSNYPQLDTLEVGLYAAENEDEKVRDLIIGTDFTYVADGNYLHFEEDQIPPSEHYVVAKYRVSATAVASDTDGGTP